MFNQASTPQNTVKNWTFNLKEGCTCHVDSSGTRLTTTIMWALHSLSSAYQALPGSHCTTGAINVRKVPCLAIYSNWVPLNIEPDQHSTTTQLVPQHMHVLIYTCLARCKSVHAQAIAEYLSIPGVSTVYCFY